MKRWSVITIFLICVMLVSASCAAQMTADMPGAPAGAATAQRSVAEAPAPPAQAAATAPGAAAPPPMAAEAAQDASPEPSGITYGGTDYLQVPIVTPDDERGRRMSYTLEMILQTTNFDSGVRLLLNTVDEMGGEIYPRWARRGRDMRDETPAEQEADFSLRIPTVRLAEFIAIVENGFNIYLLEQEVKDQTEVYQRTDFRLSDLRDEESRLLEELEEVEDDYRAPLQSRLNEVRRQIREAEMAQAAIMQDVVYSTVIIRLYEVILPEEIKEEEPLAPPTFGERLGDTALNSMGGILAFFQGFIIVIITLIPFFLFVGAVVAIIILIMRANKRRRQRIESDADNAAQPPDEDNK